MKIVAIRERADGNESVGTEWLETKIFDSEMPISEILRWAGNGELERAGKDGRVMITVPNGEIE